MNLQYLKTFCIVMSENSMTEAAKKLSLTQPAISQQIRSLETELKVQLFYREGRKLKSSLQAQLLYDYAKSILQLTHKAEVAMQAISEKLSGHLRIMTKNSLGLFLLSPIVGFFLKHNPKLTIRLTYGSEEETIEKMKKQEVDICILPDLIQEYPHVNIQGYDKNFLMRDEVSLVATGQDPAIPQRIEPHELNNRPVAYGSDFYPQFSEQLKKVFVKNQITFMPIFESENMGTLKRVIESGLGWGFLPLHCIAKQLKMGRIKKVGCPELEYSVDLMVYSRKEMESVAGIFLTALQQRVRENLLR